MFPFSNFQFTLNCCTWFFSLSPLLPGVLFILLAQWLSATQYSLSKLAQAPQLSHLPIPPTLTPGGP